MKNPFLILNATLYCFLHQDYAEWAIDSPELTKHGSELEAPEESSQVNIGALGIGSEIKHKAPTVYIHTLNLHAKCSRKSDANILFGAGDLTEW